MNTKNTHPQAQSLPLQKRRALCVWLAVVLLFMLATIWTGGVTRLTDSGLSMVDWKPLMGVVPPISESDWQEKFIQYKQFPEYQQLNVGMSLNDFKWIFFWEYIHRMLARSIGIVFFIPFVFFLIRYKLPSPIKRRLGLLFVLGGCQGLLGWFMVKSGLQDVPYVSHLRLTAHLCLAVGIFGYMFWTLLNIWNGVPGNKTTSSKKQLPTYVYVGFISLIYLQIAYGGLTAGLHAGLLYSTFPLMGGGIIPPDFWNLNPAWLNFFNYPPTVQWVHRTLGWLLFFFVHVLWFFRTQRSTKIAHGLLVMVWIQFGLGVITLLAHVPTSIASMHQIGALVLWILGIFYVHKVVR
jgi:cytochrome c oxidase assembly protein subunit 15